MKNAYFTIEAALVLPVVMSILISTVFLFLFQYNRCLWEQDLDMLALYFGTASAENIESLRDNVQNKLMEFDSQRYIAWEIKELNAEIQGTKVTLKGTGETRILLPEWSITCEDGWETTTLRSVTRLSPVDYIRLRTRVMGGQ